MHTLLLVDGSAIMYRAFFALPPLNNKDGTPTNAIYGFFMMLHKVIGDFRPDEVVVCLDYPKKTFRKELSERYQAHRPKIPDELRTQIPLILQLLNESGVASKAAPGYEADDVIGTLTTKFKKDHRILILTGDKDIMQLIDDNVYVISPKVGISSTILYDRNEVFNKLGVQPEKIPDYKALAGDPSDNYPGAKGIGPKTAAKLITEYGNVEHLLEKLEAMPEGRTKTLLKEHLEDVKLSKTLATIVTDLDLDITEEQITFKGYKEQMRDTLRSLELYSLMAKLYSAPQNKPEPAAKPTKEKKEPAISEDQQSLF